MALTPTILAPQGGALVTYNVPTVALRAQQAGALSAFLQTAGSLRISQAGAVASFSQPSQIRVVQAGALAVVRGRIANARLRVWTFTLDGHDFFVLRLGDDETLLYDVYSQQWVPWDSFQLGAWRANTGFTWVGGQSLAFNRGSSVVVGDDTFGLLWFLDPDQPWDEAPDGSLQKLEFTRIATGQIAYRGRDFIPCYVVYLDGDNYGLTTSDFIPSVRLDTSDDQGRTFVNRGTLTAATTPVTSEHYRWQSLGQIGAPGRLFRITDNGLFARLDTMEVNDDAG